MQRVERGQQSSCNTVVKNIQFCLSLVKVQDTKESVSIFRSTEADSAAVQNVHHGEDSKIRSTQNENLFDQNLACALP